MKQTITISIGILVAVLISTAFYSLDETGKVHLKITKEENGNRQVFEKQYNSMDELQSDDELKNFDVLAKEWVNEDKHEFAFSSGEKKSNEKIIVIKKKSGDEENITWISDGEEKDIQDENVMIFKNKDGKVERNVIKIKTDDGEENFTMEIEGDGDQKMIWIDEDGNKTELTKEKIDEKLAKEGADKPGKTHKIEVITTDDDNDFVIEQDGKSKIIEVEIEKEIADDGTEKVINKKVWVTEDGKKIELDGEGDVEFLSEGDNIIIKTDKESLESADFSDGKFDGENNMVFRNKNEGDPGVKQTMNVNIDEKNGEKFIEIDIKRDKDASVTISEIDADDSSLSNSDLSLKDNLKPSNLKYYPNPGSGRFTLNFVLDKKDEVIVTVTDIVGKEVYKENLPNFQGTYNKVIDLSAQKKGIYILQVNQKKKTLSRKILIE